MSEARGRGDAGGWGDDGAPDPLWARARTGLGARFVRLGFVVDVDASDPLALDWAAQAYGAPAGGGASDAAAGGRVADLSMTVVVGPPPGGDGTIGVPGGRRAPATAAKAARAAGAPTVFREHGAHFAATDGGGGLVVADLAAGTAVAWIDERASVERAVAHLLEAPLWRLATWRGWLALHAAAVVVDGVAVVLRGPSGAGKSAAAAAADRAGLAVLAEEVAWIDPAAGTARAAALATHEAVRPAVVRGGDGARASGRAGSRGGGAGDLAAGDRAKVARPLVGRGGAGDVPLGPLVFLAPPDGGERQPPLRWSPTPGVAAIRRFEAERIAGEHAQPAERWTRVRARLTARAVAMAGGTPAERVATLPEVVAWWRAADGR